MKGDVKVKTKYYPVEDAINNVSAKLKLGLKDAYDMDEEEFDNVAKYVSQYVEWVKHPDYWHQVPKVIATGELILDE